MSARERNEASDAGFTLMEVMVSMAIVAIILTALVPMLMSSANLASQNALRVTASGLVNRSIETLKGRSIDELSVGSTSSTVEQGGTEFTVTETISFAADKGGANVCAGVNQNLSYYLVTSVVTWSGMGSQKPIQASTTRATGLTTGSSMAKTGTLAVHFRDASGKPISRGSVSTVARGAKSALSGTDGCAVISGINPGTYSITLSSAGRVDDRGQAMMTRQMNINEGRITRVEAIFHEGKEIKLSLPQLPSGTILPDLRPVSFSDVRGMRVLEPCTGANKNNTCYDEANTTIRNVYPGDKEVWRGTCRDSRASQFVKVDANATKATTLKVRYWAAKVKFINEPNPWPANTALFAVHRPDQGCAGGEVLTYPSVTKNQTIIAVPAGTWQVSLDRAAEFGGRTETVTMGEGFTPTLQLDMDSGITGLGGLVPGGSQRSGVTPGSPTLERPVRPTTGGVTQ